MISFTYGDCEVKDSLQFLPASLDKLSETLSNDPYINDILEEALSGFEEHADELRPFIRRKGLLPYSEITSIEKLNSVSIVLRKIHSRMI
jgi:hypothetical protein